MSWKELTLAAAILSCAPAQGQVPPGAGAAASYSGLHAAAHKGDAAAIRELAAAGSSVNARDGRGRTPLHVATFARQRAAIRALAQAGADLHLLENDRYDCVTIAAVADDARACGCCCRWGRARSSSPAATTGPRSSPPRTLATTT